MIDQLIRRLHLRIINMVAIGRIRLVDDTGPVQLWQVEFPPTGVRVTDRIPAAQHFGFTSNPPLASEAVTACLMGDPSKAIGVGSNNQPKRLRGLAPGESAQYDASGKYIRIFTDHIEIFANGQPIVVNNASQVTVNSSGDVDVNVSTGNVNVVATAGNIAATAAAGLITLTAPTVKVVGNLSVSGDITDESGTNTTTVGTLRTKYNAHQHPYVPGSSGLADTGTTTQPDV